MYNFYSVFDVTLQSIEDKAKDKKKVTKND